MTAANPEHTSDTETHTAEVIELRPDRVSVAEPEVVDVEILDEDQEAGTEVSVRPKLTPNVIVPTSVRKAGELAKRPDRVAAAVLKHELVYGSIGTARGLGSLWRWMTAAELDQQLATKPELVLDTRRKRRNITLAGAGTLTGGGIAAWLLVGPGAVIIPVLLVLTVAGAFERRRAALGNAEAGHKALGASPSGKEVKKVFVSAGLAKRTDDLRIVGPVTRTDVAWEATAELPPGTTYKAATKKRGELAAAIGVDEVQVALDPVKGHNGRVRVWVADDDPMQGDRIQNPLVGRTQPFNFWRDKVFAGRDARGREVSFSLVERSYLIGGEPGGGKSVASNNILAAAVSDPNLRLFQADGKFGFDLAVYEAMAEHVVTEPGHTPMMDMLEIVRTEMSRRYALLRKIGTTKVTEAVAKKHDLHPILLHIDEIQTWSASGEKSEEKEFIVAIADIVGRGRAAGIITGAVTQRPAAEVVPTRLRDILSIRWALRCTNPIASDTILGSGRASQGYSSAMFNADQRGAGFLLAEGSSPIQTRSAFMTEDETRRVTDRAFQWRKEAGTLPATADRPEIRLLTTILDVMTHPKGIHTVDLLPLLAAASDEYAGWDATRLSTAVKGVGLIPGQVDIEGRNRNGYRRDRTQAALDRA
ncbi:FtsK/SpoIIIE domain-containing protein [Nocardiopsis sp. YSL2]|uniref:FtsK/SpoIIIE domain-containing protein n=1 Tax=Nocardiopsis sp. YSL2 TaxID=2939492 RepID=UPI0026F4283F|nr:FtsK/SpoIIIE domain-containing protein [Nocardiopsis sp. YSL2]